MTIELLLSLFLALFVLAVLIYTPLNLNKRHTQSVYDAVEKSGGPNIHVSRRWVSFDRDNDNYKVAFEDSTGQSHWTTCKVRRFGKNIYGSITPNELLTPKY